MTLDGTWPWASELGEDQTGLPGGFTTLAEAQAGHDDLGRLWDRLPRPEKEAFLLWFREEGPDNWPWSAEEVADLADALQSLTPKSRWRR
jgi:hypothetical protein